MNFETSAAYSGEHDDNTSEWTPADFSLTPKPSGPYNQLTTLSEHLTSSVATNLFVHHTGEPSGIQETPLAIPSNELQLFQSTGMYEDNQISGLRQSGGFFTVQQGQLQQGFQLEDLPSVTEREWISEGNMSQALSQSAHMNDLYGNASFYVPSDLSYQNAESNDNLMTPNHKGLWYMPSDPQIAFDSVAPNTYASQSTQLIHDHANSSYNDLDHSSYGSSSQWSTHYSTPLGPVSYDTRLPFQNTNLQQTTFDDLGFPTCPDINQSSTPQVGEMMLSAQSTDHILSSVISPNNPALAIASPYPPTPMMGDVMVLHPFHEKVSNIRIGAPKQLTKKQKSAKTTGASRVTKSRDNNDPIYVYDPKTKRLFNSAQKAPRENHGKAKHACFVCKHHKRTCDGESQIHGPCSHCKRLLSKYADRVSLPRFTCNVETKFAELNLFYDQPIEFPSKNTQQIYSYLYHRHWSSITSAMPAASLLDALEPVHARNAYPTFHKHIALDAYSYCRSFLKWKSVLIYLFPKHFEEAIESVRVVFRVIGSHVLALVDIKASFLPKQQLLIVLGYLYDEVCSMESFEDVDQNALGHLKYALEHRLAFLHNTLSANDSSAKKLPNQRTKALRVLLSSFQYTSKFLLKVEAEPLDLATKYLKLVTSNSSRYPKGVAHAVLGSPCPCMLFVACLPLSLFEYLGLDAKAVQNSHRLCKIPFHGLDDANFEEVAQTMCHATFISIRLCFDALEIQVKSKPLEKQNPLWTQSLSANKSDIMIGLILCVASKLHELAWKEYEYQVKQNKLLDLTRTDIIHCILDMLFKQELPESSEITAFVTDVVREIAQGRENAIAQEAESQSTQDQ